jgi:hypothetical protein
VEGDTAAAEEISGALGLGTTLGESAVPEVGAGDGATDIPGVDAVTDEGRGVVGRNQMAEHGAASRCNLPA